MAGISTLRFLSHQYAVLLGLSISCIGFASLSVAQSNNDESGFDVLEEIIVTARKRDERLQETPVSVTAFTAEKIKNAGIEHARDYLGLTPNVHIADTQDPSLVAIQVRGIGQIRNGEAPVAIVEDGIIMPSALSIDQDLIDLEQIEVLRGPQGALYGRNAIGGAINITTKAPTNEFEGRLVAGAGNGDLRRFIGFVSGPLVEDKLFFRLAGSHKESDGLIFNPTEGANVDFINEQTVRARLQWLVNDKFSIDGRFAYNQNNGGSGAFALASVANGQPGATQITTIDQQANTIVSPRGNLLGNTDKDSYDYAIRADLETSVGLLTSISAYSDLHQIAVFPGPDYSDNTQCTTFTVPFFTHQDCPANADGTPGIPSYFGDTQFWHNYQEYELRTFSQELRFTSPSDKRIRYIIGAYFLSTSRDLDTVNNFDVGSGIVPKIILDPTVPNRTRNYFSELNENDATAFFAQVNFDLSDALELSLSGRYDKDKRSQFDPRPHDPRDPQVTDPMDPDFQHFREDGTRKEIPSDTPRSRSVTFDSFQPKVTLNYQASDDVSFYGTYAEGFRSGGFNAPGAGAIDGVDDIYGSEKSQNFELGFKSQWLSRRLTLNGAIFTTDVDNLQVFNFHSGAGLQVVTILDEVEIRGGELELNFLATPNFELYAGVGVADTEIIASTTTPAAIGNEVPYNTKLSANMGAQYSVELSSMVSGIFRIDFEHKGDTPFHEGGHFSGIPVRDALTLLNARVSIVVNDEWRVTLWGRNLTDEEYWGETVVPDYAYQADVRTYGIDFSKSF